MDERRGLLMDGQMIPLKEYAERNGRSPRSARQMAQRGGFKTAKKIGRDWLIDESEPYPDGRVRTGKYKKRNRQE